MRRKTSAGRPLLDLRGIDALTRLRYAVTPKPLTVNPKTLNPTKASIGFVLQSKLCAEGCRGCAGAGWCGLMPRHTEV